MKKIIFNVLILLFAATFVDAEQLTKIGIIDLSSIVSNYFKESRAWRELEEMQKSYEAEKARIQDEIEQLQSRKMEALNQGDNATVLKLDNEIFNKKDYLKEYTNIKYTQLVKKRENLLESSTLLSEILKEIQYIAESEGYSAVFRSKDPDLIWWSPNIDITNKVLDRLKDKASGTGGN
ncbi:MAG: OmpH family outer membrane protein [Spirochaetota bacterium]